MRQDQKRSKAAKVKPDNNAGAVLQSGSVPPSQKVESDETVTQLCSDTKDRSVETHGYYISLKRFRELADH